MRRLHFWQLKNPRILILRKLRLNSIPLKFPHDHNKNCKYSYLFPEQVCFYKVLHKTIPNGSKLMFIFISGFAKVTISSILKIIYRMKNYIKAYVKNKVYFFLNNRLFHSHKEKKLPTSLFFF